MTICRILIAAVAFGTVPFLAHAEPLGLSGFYKGEGFSMKFDGERCFAMGAANEAAETQCVRRGDLLYISPVVPKGQRMTRNVWVAYTVADDRLESSHLEDMDDGAVFYKDRRPKLVLQKQAQ